jgi:predicted nucleic acid-binding protein
LRPTVVVDAGVLAVALIDDASPGHRVRQRLLGETLAAPEIIDLEVANVVRKYLIGGRVDLGRASQAITDLELLPMTRVAHRALLARIWALHDNVASYDAAYVACAEALNIPMLTADVRLTKAPGPRCAFELLQ